jgi:hypothetical protein
MHPRDIFRRVGPALLAATLGACATNDLDRIYDDSLHLSHEITVQKLDRFRQWQERWRRGEFGPTALEPPRPILLYTQEMNALRMRFMEHELLYLLQTRCPAGPFECRGRVLRDLGFACPSGLPAKCTLHNKAYGENHTIIKASFEHHDWTVLIESDAPNSAITATVSMADATR